MAVYRVSLLFAVFLALGACSFYSPDSASQPRSSQPDGSNCVPYARWASGIQLYGDAHEWWHKAAGRYARGKKPVEGAILVLAKTKRLRYGHLAVVANIKDARRIVVDHANWRAGKITRSMTAIDISPNNDWSMMRFWNEETKAFGQVYPAVGFIYQRKLIATASIETSDSTITGTSTRAICATGKPDNVEQE